MESTNSSIVTSSHKFRSNIKKVWEILKDIPLTNKLLDCYASSFNFIFDKGSHSYEVNSDFHFTYKNFLTIHFKCLEVIETDEFCKISWIGYKYVPDFPITHIFSVNLYKKMPDSCVCDVNFVYDKENLNFTLANNAFQVQAMKDREKSFDYLENVIFAQNNSKCQFESIQITDKVNHIFQFLTNMKNLRKLIPSICDQVEQQDAVLKIGSVFKFKWYKKVSLLVDLCVQHININKESATLVYTSDKQGEDIPFQEVKWKVVQMNDSKCMLSIEHCFKEDINTKYLKILSKSKKKILINLKNICEDNQSN